MKLATYRLPDGGVRHGEIVEGGRVTDLGPGDLSALVGGLGSVPSGGTEHALDEVTLLAPLLRPGKVLAVAANYQEHVTETGGTRSTSRGSRRGCSSSPAPPSAAPARTSRCRRSAPASTGRPSWSR